MIRLFGIPLSYSEIWCSYVYIPGLAREQSGEEDRSELGSCQTVDDEVDTAVDGDQKVVGLGELVVSLVQVLSTSIISSAGKRSIGFTIGFHNHGEGPY